jgi:hypothetical protein
MKRLVLAAVAISLALAPGIGAAAGPCGVGCTIEVRDDAIVGSARETEVRVGVPVLWRLTGSREHVIASEQHLFRSPLLGRAPASAATRSASRRGRASTAAGASGRTPAA